MSEFEKRILKLLAGTCVGMTMTELSELASLSRSNVRATLANLEDSNKIIYRSIGLARVYNLTEGVI
jgi:predicted transcriptional regulator